jgi:peptide/nickel transport system permease protein
MWKYVARRIVLIGVSLLLLSVGVFALMRYAIGGDPVALMLGREASQEVIAAKRAALGLDRSVPAQYGNWLGRLLQGDLGRSFEYPLPVGEIILTRAVPTIELTVLATVFAVIIAVPAGLWAALRHRSKVDLALSVGTVCGISMPSFFLAILLIALFGLKLRWLPTSGYVEPWSQPAENLRLMALPAVALGSWYASSLMRYVRAAVLDQLRQPYVAVARSKGLGSLRVVWVHIMRNVLIPLVTMVGMNVPFMLGGAVTVETVFAISGLGRTLLGAILARDYPVVQATMLLLACATLVTSLVVDLLYAVIDPRLSYE